MNANDVCCQERFEDFTDFISLRFCLSEKTETATTSKSDVEEKVFFQDFGIFCRDDVLQICLGSVSSGCQATGPDNQSQPNQPCNVFFVFFLKYRLNKQDATCYPLHYTGGGGLTLSPLDSIRRAPTVFSVFKQSVS